MRRRRSLAVLALLVLTLGLAACGDDDGNGKDGAGDSAKIELSATPDPRRVAAYASGYQRFQTYLQAIAPLYA